MQCHHGAANRMVDKIMFIDVAALGKMPHPLPQHILYRLYADAAAVGHLMPHGGDLVFGGGVGAE